MWRENLETTHTYYDNQRTKIEAVRHGSQERIDTQEFTQEQLRELETNLIGESLNKIKVSRSEAFSFAVDYLWLWNPPLDLIVCREMIKDFQKINWLTVDWIIWKSTYMEMYTQDLNWDLNSFIQNQEKNKTEWKNVEFMSEKMKKRIDFSLSNTFSTNETRLELIELMDKYGKLVDWIDEDFNERTDISMKQWAREISRDPKTQEKLSQKWSNWKTFIEDLIEEWPTSALKNHSKEIILIATVAFIFWAFKNVPWLKDIPGMWSWYGRLWRLFWWLLLWGDKWLIYLINKWPDVIEWTPGFVSDQYERARALISEWYQKPKWLEDLVSNIWQSSWDILNTLEEKYKEVLKQFSQENEKNKDNPELYVTEYALISNSLNNDDIFSNTKIEDLKNAKWNIDTIKSLISDSTWQELFKWDLTDEQKNQREKDITNYVNLILSKEPEDWDIYVKDLFFSSTFLDNFLDELNKWYTENETVNQKIKQKIGLFESKSVKQDIKIIIRNIANIEKWNDRDNVEKLKQYIIDNPNLENNDKSIIEELIKIFESEAIYYEAIEEIKKIKVVDSSTEAETIESIDKKVEKLERIKEGFQDKINQQVRLSWSDNTWFEKAYNDKRLELYNKWALLDPSSIYARELNEIESQQKLSEDLEKVNELLSLLDNLPNENSKPQDFLTFYESNFDKYTQAKELLDKYDWVYDEWSKEKQIQTKLREIILKFEWVNENYETVKWKYTEKIIEIQNEINSIVIQWQIDQNTLIQHKQKLKELLTKFEWIKNECIKWYNPIDDVVSLWNKYVNREMTIPQSDNIFENIDRKIWSITEKPNLLIIIPLIETKVIEIDNAFWLDVNIANLDINNLVDVTSVVSKLLEYKTVIESMDASVKQDKERIFNEKINELVDKYVKEINNANSLQELLWIKANFETSIRDRLGNSIKDNHTNKINEAYDERLIELNPKLQYTLNSNPEEMQRILKNSWVFDFFAKYAISDENDDYYNINYKDIDKISEIEDIYSLMDNNTTLKSIILVFKDNISSYNIDYNIIEESNHIAKNLEEEIK